MRKRDKISHEILLKILNYNPESGVFRWRIAQAQCIKVGQIAGTISRYGYCMIHINGDKFYAAQLAWFYVHGKWSEKQIDHINRDKTDDRLVNLREVIPSQNNYNSKVYSNNTSGHKGVFRSRNKWRAIIQAGKRIDLGTFSTWEEAASAYETASEKLHGEFAGPVMKENISA